MVAPARLAAVALAVLGLGLIAAAIAGESFAALRLYVGLGLLVLALLASGLQVLLRSGAPQGEES